MTSPLGYTSYEPQNENPISNKEFIIMTARGVLYFWIFTAIILAFVYLVFGFGTWVPMIL